jgi:pimeloyl-ACP methyl ester carboxylesterase
MGRSDPKPGRRLLDWPLDVLEVAGHLHIDRFGVVGASGGGPYVLACASEIPDRLDFAAVLGSWAPVHGTHLAWEMAPLDRFFSRLSGGLPWLFYIPFWFLGMAAQRLSPQAFLRSLGSSMSDPDRRLAKEPSVAAFYAHDVREAFQQGVRGPADDAILLYQAWGFVLDDIRIPVRIFHGREDRFAPYAFAEYLHARIPHSILHDYSGEGHLFLYRLFGDVFSAAPPVGSDT